MRIPSLYFRLLTYVLVTGLITFISIISDSKYTSFSDIKGFDWFMLIAKSFLPSLVSLKAYFDQSFSGFPNNINDEVINTNTEESINVSNEESSRRRNSSTINEEENI